MFFAMPHCMSIVLLALALFSIAGSQPSYPTVPQINPVQVCGGSVSGVSLYIDAADRIPFSTNKNVVVSFTTQTALAPGDGITINYPSGFFAAGVRLGLIQATSGTFLSCCNPPLITSSSSPYYVVLTVGLNGTAPGPYTVTLTGVTMGAPTAGNNMNISVLTTNDLVSAGAPSGALGGQVKDVKLSIDGADRIPGATKPVTGLWCRVQGVANHLFI
jgi:hypothetical protein